METQQKKMELKIDNVMVSDKQATMTIVITASTEEVMDTTDLTGLLFSMMYAAKKVYQESTGIRQETNSDQAEIAIIKKLRQALAQMDPVSTAKEENNITKTPKRSSKRVWTPEQIERAKETKARNALKKHFEGNGKETVETNNTTTYVHN